MQLNRKFGMALVVVTHDMNIARRMETIYTLEDGVLRPSASI